MTAWRREPAPLGPREAFDASFGRQDVPALERAWKRYIRSLPAS